MSRDFAIDELTHRGRSATRIGGTRLRRGRPRAIARPEHLRPARQTPRPVLLQRQAAECRPTSSRRRRRRPTARSLPGWRGGCSTVSTFTCWTQTCRRASSPPPFPPPPSRDGARAAPSALTRVCYRRAENKRSQRAAVQRAVCARRRQPGASDGARQVLQRDTLQVPRPRPAAREARGGGVGRSGALRPVQSPAGCDCLRTTLPRRAGGTARPLRAARAAANAARQQPGPPRPPPRPTSPPLATPPPSSA